jgi:hypothetical protein
MARTDGFFFIATSVKKKLNLFIFFRKNEKINNFFKIY